MTVRAIALAAQAAHPSLARAPLGTRDRALEAIAAHLGRSRPAILAANAADRARGEEAGLSRAMLDRLSLEGPRWEAMIQGLHQIQALSDPLGEVVAGWTRPNGLRIEQVRVPLGVVGFIYEARPNVTVEATGLCLKSGNTVVLRGGSAAQQTNEALVRGIREALEQAGLDPEWVQGVASRERGAVDELLALRGVLDVVIPRGGAALIRRVVEQARVPVIETGTGNCHLYVDESADFEMATRLILNAKCQRPGVCNAAETLLVHAARVPDWLPGALEALAQQGVTIRGDARVVEAFAAAEAATEDDWDTEYLDLVLAVKVVDGLEAAIDHIRRHGTGHSEAIVTGDYRASETFLREVDAAAVYVNASTRFTDGGEFGFGAEVGISTQKLHARGPMGLKQLTTTKYLIRGDGQVRA